MISLSCASCNMLVHKCVIFRKISNTGFKASCRDKILPFACMTLCAALTQWRGKMHRTLQSCPCRIALPSLRLDLLLAQDWAHLLQIDLGQTRLLLGLQPFQKGLQSLCWLQGYSTVRGATQPSSHSLAKRLFWCIFLEMFWAPASHLGPNAAQKVIQT